MRSALRVRRRGSKRHAAASEAAGGRGCRSTSAPSARWSHVSQVRAPQASRISDRSGRTRLATGARAGWDSQRATNRPLSPGRLARRWAHLPFAIGRLRAPLAIRCRRRRFVQWLRVRLPEGLVLSLSLGSCMPWRPQAPRRALWPVAASDGRAGILRRRSPSGPIRGMPQSPTGFADVPAAPRSARLR